MKIKHNIFTTIIIIGIMIFLSGCEYKNRLGTLDNNNEIYNNDYFKFEVTQKLNYTFKDKEDTNTINIGDLKLTELFNLVDEETNDVVEGYYTDIKGSIDKIVKEFVLSEECKKGVVNHSDIFKNGKYMSVDFENDLTSYRVSFIERKNYCLIFVMTYKSYQDKNVRTKYTDYIYFK